MTKSKKCNGCNHAVSRHFVIVDHEKRTASQHCKTCGGYGAGNCSAIRQLKAKDYENLTTDRPILNFHAWNYYDRILRPTKPKQKAPKGFKEWVQSMRDKE